MWCGITEVMSCRWHTHTHIHSQVCVCVSPDRMFNVQLVQPNWLLWDCNGSDSPPLIIVETRPAVSGSTWTRWPTPHCSQFSPLLTWPLPSCSCLILISLQFSAWDFSHRVSASFSNVFCLLVSVWGRFSAGELVQTGSPPDADNSEFLWNHKKLENLTKNKSTEK